MSVVSPIPFVPHSHGEEIKMNTIDGIPMPRVISTIEEEYASLRERAAISDQSHFAKFRVSGSDAVEFLSYTNLPDIARLPIGKTASSFMLNANGSIFCECYIVAAGDSYLLLTEGKPRAEVVEYLNHHSEKYDVSIRDISNDFALYEIDGPYAWEVLKDLVGVKILGLRYLETLDNQKLGTSVVQILRAGKTGEFGYCIIVSAEQALDCWNTLIQAGERYQMLPVGSDVLDLCRLENRFPNVRLDASEVANPFEMNCRVMFDREKEDHLGRSAMEQIGENGPERRIIGLILEDASSEVPQLGDLVKIDGFVVGKIVNSGFSYLLGKPICLALMQNEVASVGLDFSIGQDNRRARSVSAPFVQNKSMSIRPQEHSFHTKS